jgi:hypothetical protein
MIYRGRSANLFYVSITSTGAGYPGGLRRVFGNANR